MPAAASATDPSRRRLVELTLVFVAFVLPSYLSTVSPGMLSVSRAVLPVLLTALPQAGLLVYLLAVQGEARRPELGLRAPRGREVLQSLALLAAMLALLASTALVVALTPAPTREALRGGARFRLAGPGELPAAVLFCLAAAAREELLFRAYLTARLGDLGFGAAAAALASAALFAAAHVYQGPLAVGLAFAQGLLLGWAFVRTRSIGVPVLAHAGHNFLVLAASLLPGGGLERLGL